MPARAGIDGYVPVADVITELLAERLYFAQQQCARGELLHARLRIEIEMPDALDLVDEPLQPDRPRMMKAEDVHDPSADGELPAAAHLGNVLVPCGR